MTFSWDKAILEARKTKLRRAKNMARGQVNSDFDVQHANEVREYAQTKTYVELTTRVTTDITKRQDEAIRRRLKRIGQA